MCCTSSIRGFSVEVGTDQVALAWACLVLRSKGAGDHSMLSPSAFTVQPHSPLTQRRLNDKGAVDTLSARRGALWPRLRLGMNVSAFYPLLGEWIGP